MTAVPRCEVRGQGETLLFLHGVGGGHGNWSQQLTDFSGEFLAAAWDMPGYGDSAPLAGMTFPALSGSLLALLDDRGWDRVHLVGHSMGGMVAQEFAADHQDRLLTLTLSATSAAFGRSDGDFQTRFVAERLGPLDRGGTMADIAAGLMTGFMGPNAAPGALQAAMALMEAVPAETYRAAVRCITGFDRRDALAGIRVPTLVLAGESDRAAPAAMMERMAQRIPGAEYACLSDAGHLANMERPNSFNSALRAFLARHSGGSAP